MSAHERIARPAPKSVTNASHAAQTGVTSTGHALDTRTDREMSARFGHDFSKVRIHTDSQAFTGAEAVGADAYALGSDIVFGAGLYQPGSRETDRLLAHELTHVVQQDRFGRGDWGRPSAKSDPSEREAARAAQQVLAGQSVTVTAAPGAAVARAESDEETAATPAVPATPPPAGAATPAKPSAYDRGRLTYDSEADGAYVYHPTAASGDTAAHGYDMKTKTGPQARQDFQAAGIDAKNAQCLAKGVGLSGDEADAFADDNTCAPLTEAQQRKLFENTYPGYEARAKRIFNGVSDNDFDSLVPAAQSVTTDLIYQGVKKKAKKGSLAKDNSRIFQDVAAGDLEGARALSHQIAVSREKHHKEGWDRYKRRTVELDQAIRQQKLRDDQDDSDE